MNAVLNRFVRCICRLSVTSIAMFAFHSATAAEEMLPWHPYREVAEKLMFEKFIALPPSERDKVIVDLKIQPDSAGRLPQFALQFPGQAPVPIVMDAEHRLKFPLEASLLQSNPMVVHNAESTVVNMEISIRPALPGALEFRYRDLLDAVGQANRAIAAAAGIKRFLIPKTKAVELVFAKGSPAQVEIAVTGNPKIFKTDADGKVRLEVDDDLITSNPLVRLSRAPIDADFD